MTTYSDAFNLRTGNVSFNNVADAIDGATTRHWGGTSTGTSTAYALAPSPTWAALNTGDFIFFTPHTTNTGSSTVAIGAAGTPTMRYKNAALVGGELVQDVETVGVYDGTYLNLLVHGGGWASWTPTWATFNSQTFGPVSYAAQAYQRHGNTVHFIIDATGTAGGTPSYGVSMSPPVATSSGQGAFGAFVADGGASKGGFNLWSGGNIIICKYDLSNITAGTVQVAASGTYRVS